VLQGSSALTKTSSNHTNRFTGHACTGLECGWQCCARFKRSTASTLTTGFGARTGYSAELCRAHRFIVKYFGIATIGVAASQLPDLEERIPVDVLDNVFDRDSLEDLCAQHLWCRWRVCLVCPVDLQRELTVITANPPLNAWYTKGTKTNTQLPVYLVVAPLASYAKKNGVDSHMHVLCLTLTLQQEGHPARMSCLLHLCKFIVHVSSGAVLF
jgi:hypothetical protein